MIAVALLTLVPGGVGGSETYARALVRSLDPESGPYRVVVPPAVDGLETRLPVSPRK